MVPLYNYLFTALLFLVLFFTRLRVKPDAVVLAWISLLCLGFISGSRFETGGDYQSYRAAYLRAGTEGLSVSDAPAEIGAEFLRWSLYQISEDPQLFFYVNSAILLISVGVFLQRYSADPLLSVYLFVTLGPYFIAHNITVQFTAMAILLNAVPMLLSRRSGRYIALVLLASLVHVSALIALVMVPLVAVGFRKAVAIWYLFVAIALPSTFFSVLPFVQGSFYEGYQREAYGMAPASWQAAAVPVAVACLGLILLARRGSSSSLSVGDPGVKRGLDAIAHSAALTIIFYLISVTSALIMERVGLYFYLPLLLSLPTLVRRFGGRWEPVIRLGLVLAGAGYFFLANGMGQLNPTPYLTFWDR